MLPLERSPPSETLVIGIGTTFIPVIVSAYYLVSRLIISLDNSEAMVKEAVCFFIYTLNQLGFFVFSSLKDGLCLFVVHN